MIKLDVLFRPVVTLSSLQFNNVCMSLGEKIIEISKPDLIVVVPRAGVFIWEELKSLPDFADVAVVHIKAQRLLTKHKSNSRVKHLFARLPRRINDFLRYFESSARELLFSLRGPRASRSLVYDESVVDSIVNSNRIVIIDDAIDSGESINSIFEFIKSINTLAKVHIAVITTTFSDPIVRADISLYDRQIIRFPWAVDYVE